MHRNIISNWLFFTAFMVFAMAVIGAVTRLTGSGLSMVEWRPLIGALPPLHETEWSRVFALYQDTPEYQYKNFDMNLDEFKTIFFWEWFHRLWGRLIGVVYALPLFYFWARQQIPEGYKTKLLIGLILGGSQAVMGWYMVASGLVDRPSVSHFRLAAHLGLAFIIFSYLLWLAFDLCGTQPSFRRRSESTKNSTQDSVLQRDNAYNFCLKRHGWISFALLALTIIWGAFVAGLDAGMVYNTWPKMGAHWLPQELTALSLIFNEPVSVQFVHRWIAIIAGISVITFALRVKNIALAGMVLLQIGLGIATLLSQVHIHLATTHQAGAFILVSLIIHQLHKMRTK